MFQRRTHCLLRACLFTAFISLSFSSALFADVFAPNSALPPVDSVYFFSPTCISTVCLSNIQLSGFRTFSTSIVGGDELTTSFVDLTASLFQNAGGVDGPFIGPLRLTGQVDITYLAKTSLFGAGRFSSEITSLDLSGSFNGLTGLHTVDVMLNPNQMSTGETTATLFSAVPEEWRVSSFFNVFAELSIDGGPFVAGPERFAVLGTPEPGYYFPLGVGFAFILTRRIRARRSIARALAS